MGACSARTSGTSTPQYVYYILPLSVLLAALVTIGLLTKNSELVVMKACGISLYRVALPMLAGAIVAGGVLFLLEQTILGPSNRRAEAIRHVHSRRLAADLRRAAPPLGRRQRAATSITSTTTIRAPSSSVGLSIYEFGERMPALARRTFAERAVYVGGATGGSTPGGWNRAGRASSTDTGETTDVHAVRRSTEVGIESTAYFTTQQPDERFMSYSQLRDYTERLRGSGFDVSAQLVALERKISFPFVTLVMTLLAVPFAVTTGRRGAMYGIGVGIVLAITYWVAISVFAALGTGGLVTPALAAWAPNLLFGAGAGYLLLTVRTDGCPRFPHLRTPTFAACTRIARRRSRSSRCPRAAC